jgi:hypothetical protein
VLMISGDHTTSSIFRLLQWRKRFGPVACCSFQTVKIAPQTASSAGFTRVFFQSLMVLGHRNYNRNYNRNGGEEELWQFFLKVEAE